MQIDRKHVNETFLKDVSIFDKNDIKIKLKIDHTYRVASLCERIAHSLHLNQEDIDLVWLLGIFHDLGRFVQVQQYGTFYDSLSENHALLSCRYLFSQNKIREYILDPSEDPLIKKAVFYHNVYALPKDLTNRELLFAQILRDADKIDILKVNLETPLEDIYDVSLEELKQEDISNVIIQDALSHRLVDLSHAQTHMDHYVAHICFVYGLVYPESIRIMKQQGYLEQLLDFPSENPDTKQALSQVQDHVAQYMKDIIDN